MKIKSELYRPELHCSVPSQKDIENLKNCIDILKEKYNITSTKDIKAKLHLITNYKPNVINKIMMGLTNSKTAMRPSEAFLHLLCDDLNINFEKLHLISEQPKEELKDIYHEFYNTIPESYRHVIGELRNVGINTFNHGNLSFCCESYAKNYLVKITEEFYKILNMISGKIKGSICYECTNEKPYWRISL
jgi:hypothetical protein